MIRDPLELVLILGLGYSVFRLFKCFDFASRRKRGEDVPPGQNPIAWGLAALLLTMVYCGREKQKLCDQLVPGSKVWHEQGCEPDDMRR